MNSQSNCLSIAAAVLVANILLSLTMQPVAAVENVPDRRNDKALFVHGLSTQELDIVLSAFAATYKDELRNFRYLIRAEGPVQHAVFPNDLEPRLFSFLVNYAQYPQGLNLTQRSVISVGTATVTAAFGAPAEVVGRKAVLYVPTDDGDFDLVYVAVGEKTFRQSFTNMRWKRETDRRMAQTVQAYIK
ncbi:MAG TPA: hypothetical protein VK629_08215 [Steroidobacteraceae bacterium]|nr:hypothetical protein [Steroidobacteraceae bacterium]